jgi:hypothetical protein
VDSDTNSGWRLKNCPRCEYSLEGLPLQGACPECGRDYDSDSIFLYGYGTGSKTTTFNRAPANAGAQLIGPLMFLIYFVYTYYYRGFRMMGGYFLVMPIILAPYVWQWLMGRGSKLAQIKLTREGFAQGARQLGPVPFATSEAAKVTPWNRAGAVLLALQEGDRVHIKIGSAFRSWRLTRIYVEAIVDCTKEEMDSIARRINEWRGDINVATETP